MKYKVDTMIGLVSEQTIPNILPVLEYRPDCVFFFSTAGMYDKRKDRAIKDSIFRYYKPKQIKFDHLSDPFDISRIQDEMITAYSELDNPGELIVNLTGGTKPMSIAAFSIFFGEATLLYLPFRESAPATDYLVYQDGKWHKGTIDSRLDVESYLLSYGAASVPVSHSEIDTRMEARKSLTMKLVNRIASYQEGLSCLAYKLSEVPENTDVNRLFPLVPGERAKLALLIDLLSGQLGQLEFCDYGLKCRMAADEVFYLCGGWLEEYVFMLLQRHQKQLGIDDIQLNVKVGESKTRITAGDVRNEFDICFTKDNRLFIIECKSGKDIFADESKVINKIDSLKKRYGGLGAKGIIITQREVREAHLRKAFAYDLRIICGRGLNSLVQEIEKIIE